MKAITLTTATARRRAERSAISEAVRRALTPRRPTPANTNTRCRDALHRI